MQQCHVLLLCRFYQAFAVRYHCWVGRKIYCVVVTAAGRASPLSDQILYHKQRMAWMHLLCKFFHNTIPHVIATVKKVPITRSSNHSQLDHKLFHCHYQQEHTVTIPALFIFLTSVSRTRSCHRWAIRNITWDPMECWVIKWSGRWGIMVDVAQLMFTTVGAFLCLWEIYQDVIYPMELGIPICHTA